MAIRSESTCSEFRIVSAGSLAASAGAAVIAQPRTNVSSNGRSIVELRFVSRKQPGPLTEVTRVISENENQRCASLPAVFRDLRRVPICHMSVMPGRHIVSYLTYRQSDTARINGQ